MSTVWCVSAGRTPVFPDWFRRVSYRTYDPDNDGDDTLVCEFDRTALSLKKPE